VTKRLNLGAQLTELEKTALIRRVQEAEATYFFHHTLTQESIYQALLKQPRRELHLAVARAYEQVYAEQLDEYAALLAEHYAAAQEDAKTFEYSARAGHAAMRVYANAEAIAHFTRAIETAKRMGTIDSATLQDSCLHLGRSLEMSGRFQEALQNYEEMESFALKHNDRAMQLAALVALATIHSTPTSISDHEHARTLSNLALALARQVGDRETEARVLWNLMLLSTTNGEMQPAIDYGEQSLAISRELGMHEQTAYTQNDLFRPYISLGHTDRARAVSEQAREYFRQSGNQPMLADNLGRSIIVHAAFGEFDRALELAGEAHQISEAIGNQWGQSFSQMFAGNIYFQRGEMRRAMDTMRESIRLGQASGFLLPQIWTNAELGVLFGELGEVERGIELANQSYALAAERFPWSIARAHAVLARLFLLQGDARQAEFHVEQGKAKFVNDFAQRVFDRLPLIEIELELVKKDFARAIQLADQLQDSSAPIYVRVFRSNLLYLKGKALLARGDSESAQQVLRHALIEAEKIGSRWMLWQIYAALGKRDQARAVIEFIAQNTPEELRASFLNLPAVGEVMAG